MSIFPVEVAESLRDATIAAAYELGIFEVFATPNYYGEDWYVSGHFATAIGKRHPTLRLMKLLDALVALGVLTRDGEPYKLGTLPPRDSLAPTLDEGWGRLPEVIRTDRPLKSPEGELLGRYHHHLLAAGATAAREVASLLGANRVLDIGGGAGAYARAFLEHDAEARVTIVDRADVIELARAALPSDRVDLVAGEFTASSAHVGTGFDVALLANVFHLHGTWDCKALIAHAARIVRPGGALAIVDLVVDDEKPLVAAMFSLNMALYTQSGQVWGRGSIGSWLRDAGLVDVRVRRLESAPEMEIVTAVRPRVVVRSAANALASASGFVNAVASIGPELDAAVPIGGSAREVHTFWRAPVGSAKESAAQRRSMDAALPTIGALVPDTRATDGRFRDPAVPIAPVPTIGAEHDNASPLAAPVRTMLCHAIALERSEGNAEREADMKRHYAQLMPQQRAEQLSPNAMSSTIMGAWLHWPDMPRLSGAIDRIYKLLADAGADAGAALGAHTADDFRAITTSVEELYTRTHYGSFMPLLYGNLADFTYFNSHNDSPGFGTYAVIDRYLTTPIVHELCHFDRGRDALQPLHIDECIAGWFGVHVHPEFAYPVGDNDDAIYAAPWLSQVGQAIARAFGIAPLIRAHAGTEPWDHALPPAFVDAVARLGWADYVKRRTLHFLSDTLAPEPWVALALCVGAGRDVSGMTLDDLAAVPLHELVLPPDDAFDRAIVEDGLRAMCLETFLVRTETGGSFRTRTKVPDAPIEITVEPARITSARRGEVDTVAPRYWLPPSVAARLRAAGITGYTLQVTDVAALPALADLICAAIEIPSG
ncbi:MAG TPA: class I SAM-dependent methyltransferase [Kofleriaceae bacterium]